MYDLFHNKYIYNINMIEDCQGEVSAVNMYCLDLPLSHESSVESDTSPLDVPPVSTSCQTVNTVPNTSLVCLHCVVSYWYVRSKL